MGMNRVERALYPLDPAGPELLLRTLHQAGICEQVDRGHRHCFGGDEHHIEPALGDRCFCKLSRVAGDFLITDLGVRNYRTGLLPQVLTRRRRSG